MITLGIFGDSYAKNTFNPDINEKSWVTILEETNKFEITNFSQSQSSLWYSYNLFLKNHRHFEKIIFLVTIPDRLTLPENSTLSIGRHHAIEYRDSDIQQAKQNNDEEKLKEFEIINTYWKHIHDKERDIVMHHLMVESIQKIRPDVILYPTHPMGIKKSNELPFVNITIFENREFNASIWKEAKSRKEFIDYRNGHITEDNARIVAKLFMDKLGGNDRTLSLSDLQVPSKPYEFYLKKSI